MAHSRLDRIGSIYTRVSSLLKGGAMKEDDKPLWYVVYKAFPPKYEPVFNRVPQESTIRNIYYEEDLVRAKFHSKVKSLPAIDLMKTTSATATSKFLFHYKQKQEEGLSDSEAFDSAFAEYSSRVKPERNVDRENVKNEEKQTIDDDRINVSQLYEKQ